MKILPHLCSILVTAFALSVASSPMVGQEAKAKKKKGPPPIDDSVSHAPARLPGRGLAQHDFLYCGQMGRAIHIVKDGKVAWTYEVPNAPGEMQETTLLSNGNILFAWMYGIKEISPDKKVVWSYDAPTTPRAEIHTAKAIGHDKVLFVQNGNPTQVMLATKSTNKVEPLFTIPVGVKEGYHNQTRRAWLTEQGTLVLAHTDLHKVIEYDQSGKQIWSADVPRAYSVQRLDNGNTLVTSFDVFVRELDRSGRTVWEFTPKDMPGYIAGKWCTATRLKNGNTLLTNFARWSTTANESNGPVQALEITPDKKIVWALRSWKEPAFAGALTVQLLDEPGPQERQRFGSIR